MQHRNRSGPDRFRREAGGAAAAGFGRIGVAQASGRLSRYNQWRPRYGNTVVGPAGPDWTWLRIVVERRPGRDLFTPWTSRDGEGWVRGGA